MNTIEPQLSSISTSDQLLIGIMIACVVVAGIALGYMGGFFR